MKHIINQMIRLWTDDGRNDKDFSSEEQRLIEAKTRLDKVIEYLQKASAELNDLLLKL